MSQAEETAKLVAQKEARLTRQKLAQMEVCTLPSFFEYLPCKTCK